MTPGIPQENWAESENRIRLVFFPSRGDSRAMDLFNVHLNKTQTDRNSLINNNYLLQHHDSSQVCEHEGETRHLCLFVDRDFQQS